MNRTSFATEQPSTLQLLYAGVHPQRNRDARRGGMALGKGADWRMVRVRVPAGALTAGQYLALDRLAERFTWNRSLRVTAGQSVQLHGVPPGELETVLEGIGEAGLSAGCHAAGFEFAVAVSPVPVETPEYRQLRELAAEMCDAFYPAPGRAPAAELPDHPPRKFTIGLAIPRDNSANIFAHDVGMLLTGSAAGGRRIQVYAGGSLSMPGRHPENYARLGCAIGRIEPGQEIRAVLAIACVFKRHGLLATRRHTRLKYVVDALGVNRFRAEVEAEGGFQFAAPSPVPELRIPAWRGAGDQGNGKFYYGISIPFGRVMDTELAEYKTAMRTIVERLRPAVILSPDQNIILAGLRIEQIAQIEQILAAYDLPFGDDVSPVRFSAMACAGLPTCPLALAESERVAPELIAELETELRRLGRADVPFTFRISGCSIGCIRPNMVDLGAIGRKPGHYDLYVGGSEEEARFGELYAANVPLGEIIRTIRPLLELWSREASGHESFGDFYARRFGPKVKADRLVAAEAIPARSRVQEECAGSGRACACLA